MDWIQLAVSVVLSLGGGTGIALLITAKSSNRKNDADAAAVLSDASVKMLQPLHNELALARGELRAAREEIEEMSQRMKSLLEVNAAYYELYGPIDIKPSDEREGF